MGKRSVRSKLRPAPAAAPRAQPGSRLESGLRLAAFLGLFVLLQNAYAVGTGSALERWVIHDLTVRNAALLVALFRPDIGVQAEGPRLLAPGGGLNVLNGCEGTDIAFLLIAALLVAPLAWRWRLLGLAAGLPFVFFINQLRVLVLFFVYRNERGWFEWVHGLLGPLVLVALVVAFFLFWVNRYSQPARQLPTP